MQSEMRLILVVEVGDATKRSREAYTANRGV